MTSELKYTLPLGGWSCELTITLRAGRLDSFGVKFTRGATDG